MYLQHFDLKEPPFGLTPDTQFFYDLPSHREALNVLLIALQNGEGFIKITGQIGTGKTMLCRKLLNELKAPFITAYIPNPHLTALDLRLAIADELGIRRSSNKHQSRLLKQLNSHLIKSAGQGKKTVLIIDEAQSMPLETLETLRLLTNLETEKQKLLQIVLFGQTELDQLLQQKLIRQLRQRITFSYKLSPMSCQQTSRYICHRLSIAGSCTTLFSPAASIALHYYSRGIPRLINILAHKAMLAAYGKGLQKITLQQIQAAAIDSEDTQTKLHFMGVRSSYLMLLSLSIVLFIYFLPSVKP